MEVGKAVGKARMMMQSSWACAPIQLTYVNASSGWWRKVGPCEKPPGALV